MTRISETYTAAIALEGNPGDVLELEATFDIDGEDCPSEPTSWGASRGTGLELGAEFLEAHWGGLTITRDMAEKICGATYLGQIEAAVAAEFIRIYHPEFAA
jgi:hypothetical protein